MSYQGAKTRLAKRISKIISIIQMDIFKLHYNTELKKNRNFMYS